MPVQSMDVLTATVSSCSENARGWRGKFQAPDGAAKETVVRAVANVRPESSVILGQARYRADALRKDVSGRPADCVRQPSIEAEIYSRRSGDGERHALLRSRSPGINESMDWVVYWFMFPACIVIAAVATFSGISGAALMTPVFLIGFPLMGVPPLSTVAAIGTSLFVETSGFGTGVYRYWRRRLADMGAVRTLATVTVPLGILGAVAAHHAPTNLLRIGYGVAMVGVALLLYTGESSGRRAQRYKCPCIVCESECSYGDCPAEQRRRVETTDDEIFQYCAEGMKGQMVFSGIGAFIAGMISTGVGEATLPLLVRRSRFPVPVAAATSTFVVAATVFGAGITHFVQLAILGGLSAIPWNLIVWAVPGAIIGATIGTHFQGKIRERVARIFFSLLFLSIGIVFVMAFTVFKQRFGN